jgi:hypothetical protein
MTRTAAAAQLSRRVPARLWRPGNPPYQLRPAVVRSYHCLRCRADHAETSPLFSRHEFYQDGPVSVRPLWEES